MIRRPGRLVCAVLLAAAVFPCEAAGAGAAETPAQQLVSAYAPITLLRTQTQDPPCDRYEEQFLPTTVDTVLGNPRVRLVEHGPGGDRTVKRAPTAADIAGLGDAFYLDLPGDPLSAGCTYAKDFAALEQARRAPAITYAHIARQAGHPGLAVQYWFFYYFNQFNDLHEGDWEGMQITFPSSTAAGALAEGPDRIALFQHAGGERADWGDSKVQKTGTHPVVYPAAGSHATFYDDGIYIQNGRNGSGVGCDNTSQPLTRVVPRPVIVPTHPAIGSRSQWLTYLGHWGQREKGFNNGPTGPITKEQWLEPFTWMDGIRQTSPKLPGGTVIGPAPARAFCGAIEAISTLINLEARSPLGVVAIVAVLLLMIVVPVLLTRWRPVELQPLRRRRRVGQLLRAARQLYGRHWVALVGIGLTGIPIIGLAGQFAGGGFNTTLGGAHVEVSGPLADIGRPLGFAVVAGAVIALMHQLDAGEPTGFRLAYAAMLRRAPRLLLGQLGASLLVLVLILTVVGLPVAIWKYVEWQFVQQEILFRDCSIREAFRGSSRLVRGHWWYTVRVAGLLALISLVAGPMLGFLLLFTTLPPVVSNIVGTIVYALLIPYVAVGRTLLYFDLGVAKAER